MIYLIIFIYILYIPDKYYLIKYNPFLSFQEIEVNSISPFSSEAMKNIGSIAQNNEFILYGLNSEYLLFSNQNIDLRVHTKIDGLNEKISCKFIEGEEFICALINL